MRKYFLYIGAPLLVAGALGGCASTGAVSAIEGPIGGAKCDPAIAANALCVKQDADPYFIVGGKAVCNPVITDCGNGQPGKPTNVSHDFGADGTKVINFSCDYRFTWPGPKRAQVHSNGSTCVGSAEAKFHLLTKGGARGFVLAFMQPGPAPACSKVPTISQTLRPGTLVTITRTAANTDIDFGCVAGTCKWGPGGEPNSVAPAGYPFPGLRKYSLVLRVGSQQVQGGPVTSFTTTTSGELEFCVNDDHREDNTGGWGLIVEVDETGVS